MKNTGKYCENYRNHEGSFKDVLAIKIVQARLHFSFRKNQTPKKRCESRNLSTSPLAVTCLKWSQVKNHCLVFLSAPCKLIQNYGPIWKREGKKTNLEILNRNLMRRSKNKNGYEWRRTTRVTNDTLKNLD